MEYACLAMILLEVLIYVYSMCVNFTAQIAKTLCLTEKHSNS